MQLKEIRNLLVLFLKQFSKEDVNLLLNYLPIFLEDIQRDPMLLDKFPNPTPTTICFDNYSTVSFENSSDSFKVEPIQNTNDQLANYENYEDDSNQTAPFIDNNNLNQNRYSNQVIEYLNKCYSKNKYPKANHLQKMASETNLTPKQIQTWFSNTRFKLKHSKVHSPKTARSDESIDKNEDSNSNFLSIDENNNDFGYNEPNESTNLTAANLKEETKNEIKEELDDVLFQSIINRTRLPLTILEYLIKMYKINKYPTSEEIYQMSLEVNLPSKKIKNWFDSTRFKLKHAKTKVKSNDINNQEYENHQPDLNETNSVDILNDNELNII